MGSFIDNISFPIIDISAISDPSRQLAIADQITAASAEWGFLLLKGHPIPASEIQDMFSLSHNFFSLPESDKEPYALDKQNIGYIGSFKDRKRDDKMSMWFGGVPGALVSSTQLPPFWLAHAARIESFKRHCHHLVLQLLNCFALALDLPDPDYFASAHSASVGKGNSLRMLMYPARTTSPDASITRMQPHTDSGSVTLLFQQAPGLEVLSPQDEWVPAPCIDDTILVNIGDTMSFWSGGQLKATKHRVTFEGLPHDRERQSMAYFGTANPETVLEPIVAKGETMVPRKFGYNGVELVSGMTVGEYGDLIMRNIYGPAAVEKKVLEDTGVDEKQKGPDGE